MLKKLCKTKKQKELKFEYQEDWMELILPETIDLKMGNYH